MKKLLFIITIAAAVNCFGQANRKLSLFLTSQVNTTIYDRTITNNSGGFGFGAQVNLNVTKIFQPILEVNTDLFVGTKELYVTSSGKEIVAKSGVLSIYIGPSFHLSQRIFIATAIGSALYHNTVHLGIRPSIGFYPSHGKKWMAKAYFTNVFQHDDISKESLGYLSFSLALKLF